MMALFLPLSSYAADLIFGDPERFFHPVRCIGWLITRLEGALCGGGTPWQERVKGAAVSLAVTAITGGTVFSLIMLAGRVNPWLKAAVWIYFGYTAIAVKDLRVKARDVSLNCTLGAAGARQSAPASPAPGTLPLERFKRAKCVPQPILVQGIIAKLCTLKR